MQDMLKNLGERIVTLMAVCNIGMKEYYESDKRFTQSKENNKFDYELNGMLMAVKAMGIDYEVKYNSEVTQYTGLTLFNMEFKVA